MLAGPNDFALEPTYFVDVKDYGLLLGGWGHGAKQRASGRHICNDARPFRAVFGEKSCLEAKVYTGVAAPIHSFKEDFGVIVVLLGFGHGMSLLLWRNGSYLIGRYGE
ncbi:MAG: hypothetical protein WD076_11510 [Parvularculaceae bacterium]